MHTHSLSILDYSIVACTILFYILFGAYYARRQKSTQMYFVAEGKIPAWAIGISILATLISSITFLAYPGAAYESNWILLVQGFMVPIVLIFFIWFIVPMYRKVIGLSAYEYFEKRFGFLARLYSSVGFILAHFSKMGTVFFLLALAIAKMMGLSTYMVLWIIGLAVIILTLMGGIEAVIWLDVVQGFMLIGGGLLCLGIILFSVPGGPAEIFHVAFANNKISFGPYDLDFYHLTFIVVALNGIFYAIQKYGTDQTIVQRYLTAKSDKQAIKASFIGIFLSVPVWTLFMLVGTALFSYYKISQAYLPPNIRADAVFPYFIMSQLPSGVTGIILAALIAAAVSSLDADLNCFAAIGVEDYYSRLRPKSSDKQKLRVGKILVGLSGLAAIGVASLYLELGSGGALKIVFTLYAIFSGGIAGMLLLGLFSKRANKQGLYAGMIACILFTAYAVLTSTPFTIGGESKLLLNLGNWNFSQNKFMLEVYSQVVLFGGGYFASFFFKSKEPDKDLTYYGWLEKRKQGLL
jgi:SSS family solute:Na+ symporter